MHSNQSTESEFQPHQSKQERNLLLDLSNVSIWFTFVEYLFVKPDYVIPCFCNFSSKLFVCNKTCKGKIEWKLILTLLKTFNFLLFDNLFIINGALQFTSKDSFYDMEY